MENRGVILSGHKTIKALFVLCGLALLIVAFYAEENWRGKRAWEKCKADLEAKGETLDWNKFIPPPVPDDQNFFAAPKMQEWFVKSKSGKESELVRKLKHEPSSVTIAEVTIVPATETNFLQGADLQLRYVSPGAALFDVAEWSTNVVTSIQLEDVFVTQAIPVLAKKAGIRYQLDSQITYGQAGTNGEILSEPMATLRWEQIEYRAALLTLLNQYNLQLIDGSNSTVATIVVKSNAPAIYASPNLSKRITQLYHDHIGENLIAPLCALG